MVCSSVDALIDSLREIGLLRPEQIAQVGRENSGQFDEPPALAKYLVKQGWITAYQARKALAGKASELILGGYVILDKLGEGGMGKVYKARQTRLSRVVALKVIRPDLVSNELTLKRFLREAKAAARVAHPNIVRLFDADQVGDRHFLAMEYVDGTDLARVVADQGVLPVGMACSFIRQAATGLQHAHEQGVVHRDLKPSNLLLATAGNGKAGGVIKILDMGLARAGAQDEDDGATALTQQGTVIGTPDYMSPEQGKNSSTVDGRSDLYSLGCTLFYLLAGRPPFPTGTILEKLLQHQMDQPPRLDQLRLDVPPGLADVVDRLLAKRPGDRYKDGVELSAALEPYSIWDANAAGMTASGKFTRPTVPQLALASVETRPGEANPFAFDDRSTPRIETLLRSGKGTASSIPQKPTNLPTRKGPAIEDQPPPKRRRRWIYVAAGGLLISIVGLLNALGVFNSPPDKSGEQEKVEAKKLDVQPLEFCLPPDTQMIAVLNVRQLAGGRFFQENMQPKFSDLTALFKNGVGIDPFKTVDKVVMSVPAKSEQYLLVVHANEALSPTMLEWAGKLPGAAVSSEQFPGTSGPREIYSFTTQKPGVGKEVFYAAALGTNTGAFALSPSRERVTAAVVRSTRTTPEPFYDATLRPALDRYPAKDAPSLWICSGGDNQMFAFGKKSSLHDNGVDSLAALLRLRSDGTLICDLEVEAKSRNLAVNCYDHLKSFFQLASVAKRDDQRLQRIADIMKRLKLPPQQPPAEPRKDAPTLFVWSATVPGDLFAAWLGSFLD